MLPNSFTQIACHSDVQDSRYAGDHVHEVMTLTPHSRSDLFRTHTRCHSDQAWQFASRIAVRVEEPAFRLLAYQQQVPRLRIVRFATDFAPLGMTVLRGAIHSRCEDRPGLPGRSSSLGMTELFSFMGSPLHRRWVLRRRSSNNHRQPKTIPTTLASFEVNCTLSEPPPIEKCHIIAVAEA